MRITFLKTPKPREFNYIPRYYDEQKEISEERKKRLEKEMGIAQPGGYQPNITRGSITRKFTQRRRSSRASSIRLVVIVVILTLLAYYLITNNAINLSLFTK